MRFMLDTNIISDMIRNPPGKAASAMRREGDAAVCIRGLMVENWLA